MRKRGTQSSWNLYFPTFISPFSITIDLSEQHWLQQWKHRVQAIFNDLYPLTDNGVTFTKVRLLHNHSHSLIYVVSFCICFGESVILSKGELSETSTPSRTQSHHLFWHRVTGDLRIGGSLDTRVRTKIFYFVIRKHDFPSQSRLEVRFVCVWCWKRFTMQGEFIV